MANSCNGKMLVYSRVVGFYSPINNWNKGKREEFKMRKSMNISNFNEEMDNIKVNIDALIREKENETSNS